MSPLASFLPFSGMSMVNASRCQAKDGGSSGVDFMSVDGHGGQAMQVMTQGLLGGRLFGINCNFGGGQSEHVAFVMPEAWTTGQAVLRCLSGGVGWVSVYLFESCSHYFYFNMS